MSLHNDFNKNTHLNIDNWEQLVALTPDLQDSRDFSITLPEITNFVTRTLESGSVPADTKQDLKNFYWKVISSLKIDQKNFQVHYHFYYITDSLLKISETTSPDNLKEMTKKLDYFVSKLNKTTVEELWTGQKKELHSSFGKITQKWKDVVTAKISGAVTQEERLKYKKILLQLEITSLPNVTKDSHYLQMGGAIIKRLEIFNKPIMDPDEEIISSLTAIFEEAQSLLELYSESSSESIDEADLLERNLVKAVDHHLLDSFNKTGATLRKLSDEIFEKLEQAYKMEANEIIELSKIVTEGQTKVIQIQNLSLNLVKLVSKLRRHAAFGEGLSITEDK